VRLEARGGDGVPLLIAFCETFPDGEQVYVDWFAYSDALPSGEYTLSGEGYSFDILLPDEAAEKPMPGHILGVTLERA